MKLRKARSFYSRLGSLFFSISQALGVKSSMDSQAFKLKVEVISRSFNWWSHLLHWKSMGGASCSRAPKVDFLTRFYYGFHGLGLKYLLIEVKLYDELLMCS